MLVWTMICNSMEIHWLQIQCSATVSESEHLSEDGQVGPKHVAIDVILLLFQIKVALKTKVNEWVIPLSQCLSRRRYFMRVQWDRRVNYTEEQKYATCFPAWKRARRVTDCMSDPQVTLSFRTGNFSSKERSNTIERHEVTWVDGAL
jgi:hypothetical protein